MRLDVKIDATRAMRKLDLAADQVPFAAALALTRTAQQAKTDLQTAMRSSFQNPRRFTLNSLTVERATKANLKASVYVRSPSVARALSVEISGGVRDKGVERVLGSIIPDHMFAVPGSEAKRGSDGKVSLSWLRQIMAKLGFAITSAGPRRRRASSTQAYFLLPERHGRLPPGIYQRDGRQVLPLIIFTARPSYRAKFDFFGIGERSVRANFEKEFRKAAAVAMKSAR